MLPLPELLRLTRVLERAWSRPAPAPDASRLWRELDAALDEARRTHRLLRLAARHDLALLLVDTGLVYFLAGRTGQEGAAAGALATSVLALAATASLAVHALGNILPLAAITASGAACAGIHLALSAWCTDSWIVFPWGALLYVVGAGSALAVSRVARRR